MEASKAQPKLEAEPLEGFMPLPEGEEADGKEGFKPMDVEAADAEEHSGLPVNPESDALTGHLADDTIGSQEDDRWEGVPDLAPLIASSSGRTAEVCRCFLF